jgi:DNA-directed RNA polymerase subunit RPC12/RpoP
MEIDGQKMTPKIVMPRGSENWAYELDTSDYSKILFDVQESVIQVHVPREEEWSSEDRVLKCGGCERIYDNPREVAPDGSSYKTARCPYCGTKVDNENTKSGTVEFDGGSE